MTAPQAIREINRMGIDVYVAGNHDVVLRARKRGVPIPSAAILIATLHRDYIAAFGAEFSPVKGCFVDYRI